MDPIQIAQARHHTYLLLSKMFLHGLTADLLPFVQQIPQLAEACPSTFNIDQAAADHQQLFSFDIYPYESIFRDPLGLLGGPLTVQIAEIYQQSGYSSSAEPGHIGEELAYLAYLCAAEYTCLARGSVTESKIYIQEQTLFLKTHLLHWLPALEIALVQSNKPFYAASGSITLQIVAEHAASLKVSPIILQPESTSTQMADFIIDPQTNLKTIAHYLLTPPHCGFYLGRDSISSLAHSAQLPRGFGGREQMLLNLMHSAAQYDLFPEILSLLTAYATSWQQAYQQQIDHHSHIRSWIESWKNRTTSTITAINFMVDNSQ